MVRSALLSTAAPRIFFYDVNIAFHRKMLELGIPHDFLVRPGQHHWPYWKNSIKYQMLFFSNYFANN